MLQCKAVIKEFRFRQLSCLSLDRPQQVLKLNDFLYTGNLTHELMVFKFSYLRNEAIHCDKTATYYIK